MPIRPGGRGDTRGAPPRRSRPATTAPALLLAVALAAGACATAPPPATALPSGGQPIAAVSPVPPSAAATPAAPSATPGASPSPVPSATPSPSPSPSPTLAPVPDAALQARLEQLRAKLSIPGVSVAIVWDDGRSWTGAAGLADIASGTPVATGTGFAFASVSKTYTAAVVLQLVDEGRLALDDAVAPRLPALGLDPRITVRMLLDHTSGLPDFFLHRRIDARLRAAPDATWDPARSWRYVLQTRPEPGTTWLYSNTNYLLLGELVEAVTGRPLAVEIRDRLLGPLGLAHTWYQSVEKGRAPAATGYQLVKATGGLRPVPISTPGGIMPFRSVVTASGGAGSMAGTAEDAARWMRALVAGDVLSPATRAAMLADVRVTKALKARIPYGLGVQVVTLAGRRAIGHSGRYLGFRGVVRYLPTQGVAIAVFSNQSAVDPAKVAAGLLELVLPPLPGAPPSPGASGSPPVTPAGSPATSTVP